VETLRCLEETEDVSLFDLGLANGFLGHQKKKQIKYISSKSKTSLLQMSPSRK